MDLWCKENISIRGLKGDWEYVPEDGPRGKMKFKITFRFKDHSDGMMFVMKFNGEFIEK